jgi:threonine dehydrogenase-like Zn-dependent dehydrogenase
VVRAFELVDRGLGLIREVEDPRPGPGELVVTVGLTGVCGTDLGLFGADEERLRETRNHYPLRLGHEWSAVVTAGGEGVSSAWLGRAVTGETILGCGRCAFCAADTPNLCADRQEIGVRGDRPGALAESLLVPESCLHAPPDTIDATAGAMIEPAANAWRAVEAAGAGPGGRVLVLGYGTIGLLCLQFAHAAGREVHVLGIDPLSLVLAQAFGAAGTWTAADLPALRWDCVIDATDSEEIPAIALDVVKPGGRVVFVGVAHAPSLVDTRRIVRRELTVHGILGGSQGFAPAIEAVGAGIVDPRPLVGAVVGLDAVGEVLRGRRPPQAGPGPKILVDPHA